MRTINFLFLLLLLTNFSFSEEPTSKEKNNPANSLGLKDCILVEKKNAHRISKTTKKKIVLENVKIKLEFTNNFHSNYPFEAIPKEPRVVILLKDELVSNFLNEFNKMTLITEDIFYQFCFFISIYDNEKLIKSFQTCGNTFYDCETKTIYWSSENLLSKYWNIPEEENACMAFDACP